MSIVAQLEILHSFHLHLREGRLRVLLFRYSIHFDNTVMIFHKLLTSATSVRTQKEYSVLVLCFFKLEELFVRKALLRSIREYPLLVEGKSSYQQPVIRSFF